MAKKSDISAVTIQEHYIDFVLTNGNKPLSVYHFAKSLDISEAMFYEFFSSFEQIEAQFLVDMHRHTLELVEKSPDFKSYQAQEKLSTYYYTFLEIAKANRSFLKFIFNAKVIDLSKVSTLNEYKPHFIEFITPILTLPIDTKIQKINETQLKALHQGAWLQMLTLFGFWLQDTSTNFEKSDAFVEKSVKASFDLVYHSPLSSLVDLGKFIIKEGVNI
ncbi:MAG: TetR family transcriptional regulator C-terminal domain-containing protein [Chitinophagales bacterium]|jgi:AcrR family transcriptional regulator|nr:TetR family transcriptional regulator C-terminal domain-containing protein [Chitinophagales bacterium]